MKIDGRTHMEFVKLLQSKDISEEWAEEWLDAYVNTQNLYQAKDSVAVAWVVKFFNLYEMWPYVYPDPDYFVAGFVTANYFEQILWMQLEAQEGKDEDIS